MTEEEIVTRKEELDVRREEIRLRTAELRRSNFQMWLTVILVPVVTAIGSFAYSYTELSASAYRDLLSSFNQQLEADVKLIATIAEKEDIDAGLEFAKRMNEEGYIMGLSPCRDEFYLEQLRPDLDIPNPCIDGLVDFLRKRQQAD
ncbi:hypothetical protein [Epibacterium ulvae]|uniref:hypothetical protein n=1 Tax=Epibacterium ulvae TaxID=1156985 RepID=UPI002491AFA5|nr:hypothetical protein [Epibacterium ulvae]